MERREWELDSRKELVEKTVDIEAKAGLQPTSSIRKINQHPSGETVPLTLPPPGAQTQDPLMKDFWVEDTKFKP